MPRLAQSKSDIRASAVRSALGRISQDRFLYDDEKMASFIGSCKKTYQSKRKDPGSFTLRELWRLDDKGKLSDEEIIEMIRGEVKR